MTLHVETPPGCCICPRPECAIKRAEREMWTNMLSPQHDEHARDRARNLVLGRAEKTARSMPPNWWDRIAIRWRFR